MVRILTNKSATQALITYADNIAAITLQPIGIISRHSEAEHRLVVGQVHRKGLVQTDVYRRSRAVERQGIVRRIAVAAFLVV